jgi:hypothetical protein
LSILTQVFSWFPWVQERMLRWFPPFQVASTCFSFNPPDLYSVVTNCLLSYYVKWPLLPGDNPTAVNKYYYYFQILCTITVAWSRFHIEGPQFCKPHCYLALHVGCKWNGKHFCV